MGRTKVGGAVKKVPSDLLTDAECDDTVLLCDAAAISKVQPAGETEQNNVPGHSRKLIEINHDAQGVLMGRANFGGIVKQVCFEYTPEVVVGDYVLVHVGFALSKVDEEEAARTYKALEELQQLGELDVPDVDDPNEDPFAKMSSPPIEIRPAA